MIFKNVLVYKVPRWRVLTTQSATFMVVSPMGNPVAAFAHLYDAMTYAHWRAR